MRLKKHLQRWLLPAGVALLAFCAAAKLHELILSRAAMRRFEDLRQPTANNGAKQNPAAQPRGFPSRFCLVVGATDQALRREFKR